MHAETYTAQNTLLGTLNRLNESITRQPKFVCMCEKERRTEASVKKINGSHSHAFEYLNQHSASF